MYVVIFLLAAAAINAVLFFFFTSKMVIPDYANPKEEFYTKAPHSAQEIFVWPMFDIWHCRKKHKVVMGSFIANQINVLIIAYYDLNTKTFSFGSSKQLTHNSTYNEAIYLINQMYEHTPDLRLRFVRLIQLLHHFDRSNFSSDMILHDHILNSSTPIQQHEHKT